MDDWQPRQIIVPKEVFNMEIRCDLKTKNVIYVYTNLINNHKYVGKTTRRLDERHKQHIKSSLNENAGDFNCLLHKAFRKYGLENFSLEIVFEFIGKEMNNKINDILSEQEKHFISIYNTYNDGYNMTIGGEGITGIEWSSEQREKKSLFMKEYWTDDKKSERSEKIKGENNPNYGNKWSKKQKEIASEKFKDKYSNENNPMYGKKHSNETKERISEKAKERLKDKNNNPMYGKKHTEDSKKKMSESSKGKNKGKNNFKSKSVLLLIPMVDVEKEFETKTDAINFLINNYNISYALAKKLSTKEDEYVPTEHSLKLNNNLKVLMGMKFVRLND